MAWIYINWVMDSQVKLVVTNTVSITGPIQNGMMLYLIIQRNLSVKKELLQVPRLAKNTELFQWQSRAYECNSYLFWGWTPFCLCIYFPCWYNQQVNTECKRQQWSDEWQWVHTDGGVILYYLVRSVLII